jgi:hypothetical protein
MFKFTVYANSKQRARSKVNIFAPIDIMYKYYREYLPAGFVLAKPEGVIEEEEEKF